MNKAFALGFLSILFLIGTVGADDTVTFESNILAPPAAVVSISVPDDIFLGNISRGGQTERVRVDMNNTGNVAIVVTPRLVDREDPYYRYLYFQRRVADDPEQIGEFQFDISAPAGNREVESDYIYVKLDFRNFSGIINQDMLGYRSDVKFVAVAK